MAPLRTCVLSLQSNSEDNNKNGALLSSVGVVMQP